VPTFEIVQGDYGKIYRGIIENEDLSDHTAVLNLWDYSDTKLLADKTCSVSLSGTDTLIDYTPAQTDFSTISPGLYKANFVLTKTGTVERTIPFNFEVFEKEPTT